MPRIPMRPSRVVASLSERHRFARDLRALGVVTSTSDLLAEAFRGGATDGTVLVADGQTSGRGRRGRHWSCPPNRGLLFSVLLTELPYPAQRPLLSITAGVAIAEALDPLTEHAMIKWPNDVLLAGQKVAGILVDLVEHRDHGSAAILGCGVNDNLTRSDLPADTPTRAGSLSLLLGSPVDREALLARILDRLAGRLEELGSGDTAAILTQFAARDALRGCTIAVRFGDRVIEGLCQKTCPLDGLTVRTQDGETVQIPAAHAQVLSFSSEETGRG